MKPLSSTVLSVVACVLLLAGCARSVSVLTPPRADPPSLQPNPVSFTVEFHPRADVTTFRATLDPPLSLGGSAPGDIDVTAEFSQPFMPGGQSTATIMVPQTPCSLLLAGCIQERRLRVRADMASSQLFDSTGHDRPFRLQGVTTPPPPPPPAGPRIDLNLPNTNLTTVWGNAVRVPVEVESQNGFRGAVDVSLDNPPFGVTAAPITVNVPANGTATGSLNLTTVQAGTAVAPPALRMRATPQAAGVSSRTANFNLAVQRVGGSFDPVTLRTTTAPPCGSVTATVVAAGGGSGVEFSGPPFNQTNPQTLAFSAGFAISPRCRIGVVVPPVVQNVHRTGLWNLGFDPGVGAPALGTQIDNPTGVFTNGYFSKDDSLFLLVTPAGGGTQHTTAAGLYDLARGTKVGATKFFTASVDSVVLNGSTVTLNTNPPLSQGQDTWTIP